MAGFLSLLGFEQRDYAKHDLESTEEVAKKCETRSRQASAAVSCSDSGASTSSGRRRSNRLQENTDTTEEPKIKKGKIGETSAPSTVGEKVGENGEGNVDGMEKEVSQNLPEDKVDGSEYESVEELSSSSSDEDSEDEYQPTSSQGRKPAVRPSSPDIEEVARRAVNRKFKKPIRKSSKYVLPATDEEIKEKIKRGEIPDTVLYRAVSNSLYVPAIKADMIDPDEGKLSVRNQKDDLFKYVRVRQRTKEDHAEPEKVRAVIQAVRKRPIIWDQRLACHQKSKLVRRAWMLVDDELGYDAEYPMVRRKQIWKNKKDYYVYAVHSGTLEKWLFSSDMEFYHPMVDFRLSHVARPTIRDETVDNTILANRRIVCQADDRKHVLMLLMKTIFDQGMADSGLMHAFMDNMQAVMERNFMEIQEKFLNEESEAEPQQ